MGKVQSNVADAISQHGFTKNHTSSLNQDVHTEVVQKLQADLPDVQCTQSASQYVRSSLMALNEQVEAALTGSDSNVIESMPTTDQGLLLRCILNSEVPSRLVTRLDALDFEAQKTAVRLFSVVLRLGTQVESSEAVAEYFDEHPEIMQALVEGCGKEEVFTHSFEMLRICAQHAQLAQKFHHEGMMLRLINIAQHQRFDIASEAFSCLREFMLVHKATSAAYIGTHFRDFVSAYHGLLTAEDYVTQRQALRLLGEVLLDGRFMEFMLSYVDSEQFLPIHMNLLRDESKAIQLEAFHIFKVFVANPNKPHGVHKILYKNKDRLVKLLQLWCARTDIDESLAGDLHAITEMLNVLPPPVKVPKNCITPPLSTDALSTMSTPNA